MNLSIKIIILIISLTLFKNKFVFAQTEHGKCALTETDCMAKNTASFELMQVPPPLQLGVDTIICQYAYVVYSGIDFNTQLNNTSSIYVIKGTADSVWIFGTGYGDQNGTVAYLKGPGYDCTRNAIDDALQTDNIIQNIFGIPVSNAKIQFIVPHKHIDHINQEFLDAMYDSLGYNPAFSKVFVHRSDSIGSICTRMPCCGTSTCPNPWVNLFDAIGQANDTCNKLLKTFTSPVGDWIIRKADNMHTTGTLNIDNNLYSLRLVGAAGNACANTFGFTILNIHGNLSFTPICTTTGVNESESKSEIGIYPNPTSGVFTIQVGDGQLAAGKVEINNVLGEKIYQRTTGNGQRTIDIDLSSQPSGIYFYKLQNENGNISSGKLIIE